MASRVTLFKSRKGNPIVLAGGLKTARVYIQAKFHIGRDNFISLVGKEGGGGGTLCCEQ